MGFIVVMATIRVLVISEYDMRFPPTVKRTLFILAFCSHILQTILAYVTLLPFGTFDLGMKNIVFFPLMVLYS